MNGLNAPAEGLLRQTFGEAFVDNLPRCIPLEGDAAPPTCQYPHLFEEQMVRFGLVLEGVAAGVWDWKPASGETFLSPRWKEMMGYGPEELENSFHSWFSRIPEEDQAHVQAVLADYLAGRRPDYVVEHRMRHRNGHYIWILTQGAALKDAAGNVLRMSGSVTDITEAKTTLRQSKILERLRELSTGPGDALTAAEEALGCLGEALDWQRAEAWLPEESNRASLVCMAAWKEENGDPGSPLGSLIAKGEGLPGRAWAEKRTCLENSGGMRRLALPVADKRRLLAVMFFERPEARAGEPGERRILEMAAHELAHTMAARMLDESLRASQARYEMAEQVGRMGHWEFDPQTSELIWSDEVYRLYERDPAMGPPRYEAVLSYYTGQQALHIEEAMAEVRRTGGSVEMDLEALLPSKRRAAHRAIVAAHRDNQGNVVRLHGTIQDITQQKRNEERLRSTTQRLAALHAIDRAILREDSADRIAEAAQEAIAKTMPGVFFEVIALNPNSASGRTLCPGPGQAGPVRWLLEELPIAALRSNPERSMRVAELPQNTAYARRIAELLGSEGMIHLLRAEGGDIGLFVLGQPENHGDAEEFREIACEVADQLSLALSQCRLRDRAKAHARELEDRVTQATRELLDTNTRLRSVAKEREESERRVRRLNKDLKRQAGELQALNQELEAFTYSVSHDLRAPLRALEGFSRLLATSYSERLDGEALDYLERIQGASQRMSGLIDGLLTLSRLSRKELRCETVDLTAVAGEVAAELRAAEPERKAEFRIDSGMKAWADPQLLRPALTNLISNAWKFTAKEEKAAIHVGGEWREKEWVFFVKDNGAGFEMKYADRLFSAFQRLHTDKEFAGTGIGLATVQRVVHRHGGKVWAEAAPGEGASFFWQLPGEDRDAEGKSDSAGGGQPG